MNTMGFHVGGTQMQRVDLGALRKRILVALGPEKARKYWDTLRRFTRFKLSKEELDATAREVLGADNIPLHNDFIRGVFQNALLGTVSPPASEVVLDDPLEPGGRPNKKPKKKVTPQGQVVVQGPPSKALGAGGGAEARPPAGGLPGRHMGDVAGTAQGPVEDMRRGRPLRRVVGAAQPGGDTPQDAAAGGGARPDGARRRDRVPAQDC
eukprot:CAMPEP_0114139322 /NCGR_PEP_ID=MMETSP0043_2-20121206/16792_1 /TAXON_ID=464988 /ORGANISM="Hemiselmis andersenii, Strain CCMP644" /LENGTH=208 /DNA_ID=CAMNT_0001233347 /DNA_START=83 /DNA_END=705 /DNA_ORIENTATION=+